MESIVLPYGNAGWRERVRVFEEELSSRPGAPFLYNDVLVLVPSSRMKRRYGRLFVELAARHGSAALVQPEVHTLHQFFQILHSRLNGPRLMDENSRLVLLEGIVKERLNAYASFSLSPDLLAPSLSTSLANMIEQLSGAGIGPDDLSRTVRVLDFSDKPQVLLLLDVYERYENRIRESGLIDPAGMLAALRDAFDPAWLARYRRLIIDGVQHLGPLEAAVLKKMVNHTESVWFIDAPSAELVKNASEFHPLRLAKDSLGRIGTVPAIAGPASDREQLFLASALFSDRPFSTTVEQAPEPSSFRKRIDLLSAVNTREEVTLIADKVKRSLRNGTPADAILVAFPALDEYAPLVEELFTDYGIPYNRALGRPLSSSAIASVVIALLRTCQEDFSGPSLLRVFSSPFSKYAEDRAIVPSLDRFLRDQRISGGRQKILSALEHHARDEKGRDVLSGPLRDLFTALAPFAASNAASLSSWMERLSALLTWSGLGPRATLLKGPLNINLQAYNKLRDTLASLDQAGKTFPKYRYTFNEWLFLLKKTFMHTRFQVPPEDEGGVQVLGLEESMGPPWDEIYLGGLIDNAFPRRLPQNIFLPEQTLETMGVRTLEHSRLNAAYHFYRLLLSADRVTLTYPENEGDRPVVPSPFLEELAPLKQAGLLNRGVEKTSGIQFSLKIEDCRSLPELAKALSLAGHSEGLDELMNTDIEGASGIKAALVSMPAKRAQTTVPPVKRHFRVTELDEYLTCPYDYYVRYILDLEPLEEPTEDLSPMERGSKVHGILKRFYDKEFGIRAITRENREEARSALRRLADRSFNEEADTFRNRRDKELFLTVMAERFLDAEEEFWKQGFRPAYLEHKIEQHVLVLSNGGEVELSAKIDRIDVDGHGNYLVVDYKTGKYPLPKMDIDQDIFQLPVYAMMAQRALSGQDPALRRPVGLVYYDLAGKTGAGARDVVLYNREALNEQPSSKPKASPKSAGDFETIVKQGMDRARKAVENILARNFPVEPRDEGTCRSCPNEIMCREREP